MKILKLTQQQADEINDLNNQSGNHLVICDHGAGVSIPADFDATKYASQKSYLDAKNITATELLLEDEKLISLGRKIDSATYPALPSTGNLKAGDVYNYDGYLVQVIQDHARTIYAPNETPALFSIFRSSAEGLDWIANEKVITGDKRNYGGKTYQCIQSHQTLVTWTPDVTPALWVLIETSVDIPVWVQPTGAHDAYQTGDRVHFPTITDPVYESLINNNSWSPTVYPQGWRQL